MNVTISQLRRGPAKQQTKGKLCKCQRGRTRKEDARGEKERERRRRGHRKKIGEEGGGSGEKKRMLRWGRGGKSRHERMGETGGNKGREEKRRQDRKAEEGT